MRILIFFVLSVCLFGCLPKAKVSVSRGNASSANIPLTISSLENQNTNEDTPLTGISISISNISTGLDCTSSLSSTTSDTNVISAGGIIFSGTTPSCFLSLTPEANAFGSSNITLTVSETRKESSSTTFMFTVAPVNDAPIITIPDDVFVNINSPSTTINFTLIDEDSASCGSMLSKSSSNS